MSNKPSSEHDQTTPDPGQPSDPPTVPVHRPGNAKRLWPTVVLCWLVLLVPALLVIWFNVQPTYTVTAQIEVQPSPLYPWRETPDTQAVLMTSQSVLRAALTSPRVNKAPVPLGAIRQMVSSRHIPRTRFIELRVENADREHAKAIGWAILEAYLSMSENAERRAIEEASKILEEEKERLGSQLQAKRAEINNLTQVYGTTDAKMFDLLRESKLKFSEDTRKAYELAKTDLTRLQHEFEEAKQDLRPQSAPGGAAAGPANDIVRLENRLITARRLAQDLENQIRKVEDECLALGEAGRRIRELQQELQSLEKQHQVFDERAQELRVQRQHLRRMAIASEPEIRPEDVHDRRPVYSVVAAAGFLLPAWLAGILICQAGKKRA